MPDQIRALTEGISSSYAMVGRAARVLVTVCVLEQFLCVSPQAFSFSVLYAFGFNEQGASLTPVCRSCSRVLCSCKIQVMVH